MAGQQNARDFAIGVIILILMLLAFAFAGTSDWQSEVAYRDAMAGGDLYERL